MWPIFQNFGINWFGIGPLHYISSRSDFGLEFSEIFVIEKWLFDSANQGVADSPARRDWESAIECLKEKTPESESWRLHARSRGVAMVSRGVAIQNFFHLSSIYITLIG